MAPCQSPRRQTKSRPLKPVAYWDNLSTTWLTKDALRELQRRIETKKIQSHPPTDRGYSEGATSLLQQCSLRYRRNIQRHSRRGGPDLSDLRGYPPPRAGPATPTSRPRIKGSRQMGQKLSPSPSPSTLHDDTSTTPYSRNFEQHLIDHRIYLPLYPGQNIDDDNEPTNIAEIRRRLAAPRRSLDPTTFSEAEHSQFIRAHWAAQNEADVKASVFPFIEGSSTSRQQSVSRDTRFTNLAPITDGTIAQAKPDITYGARPEQLDREIRTQLNRHIVPLTNDSLPVAPNFFVEVKGPYGVPRVADRQACYYGALGARGMESLRSYQPGHRQQQQQHNSGPEPRNNAYAVTATYASGSLNLYTSHPTMPVATSQEVETSQRRPEYVMTPLRSFAVTSDVESFCAGAAAYRNARDWAGEVRDEAIARANGRLAEARVSGAGSGLHSVAEEEEE
ncbi:uncharacterized protein LDX57_005359 [Aspergillus melleus]|uniref:uncharacterized protein n=1 Tax=Aspergillus melleus TaxID=138277 RepID=UPI001E8D8F49|nr:uncharacterized protein LDX57_005359 [Aspergillus melleus]KAH8427647.1 hypothetical protein LDX57_005359 [Aspergillus melleus]